MPPIVVINPPPPAPGPGPDPNPVNWTGGGREVASYAQYSYAFGYDNRIYWSEGSRTWCLDVLTGGWTDCGYGNIIGAARAMIPGKEELALICAGQDDRPVAGLAATDPALTGRAIYYTSRMLTNGVPNLFYPRGNRSIHPRSIECIPFDGKGPDRESEKLAYRLLVYGSYIFPGEPDMLVPIGTVSMSNEGGYTESYPLWPIKLIGYPSNPNPPRNYPPGMLAWQEFSMGMVGRLLIPKIAFETDTVEVTDIMLEYSRLT